MSSASGYTRLDGIEQMRGLAALGVIVAHAVDTSANLGAGVEGKFLAAFPVANDFGTCGVDLFFVISGFVMAYSISQAPSISAGRFAWRRFKRIVPAFWLASLGFILFREALGDPIASQASLTSLTIVPVTGQGAYIFPALFVGWTLAFEICFYLMITIVLAARCKSASVAALALVVAAALLGIAWRPAPMAARFLVNPIYFEFACGIVGQLLFRRGLYGSRARRALIALLGCFLVIFFFHPVDLGISMHPIAVIDGDLSLKRSLIFGPAFMLLLLGSIEPGRVTSRFGRAMLLIGRASYSLYLTHLFVMVATEHAGLGGWRPNVYVLVTALVAGSVLLGVLVHRFVERPLLYLLDCGATLVGGQLRSARQGRDVACVIDSIPLPLAGGARGGHV